MIKLITKEYGGNTEEGSIGGAIGNNYVGYVERAEEYNYITLCEHRISFLNHKIRF